MTPINQVAGYPSIKKVSNTGMFPSQVSMLHRYNPYNKPIIISYRMGSLLVTENCGPFLFPSW